MRHTARRPALWLVAIFPALTAASAPPPVQVIDEFGGGFSTIATGTLTDFFSFDVSDGADVYREAALSHPSDPLLEKTFAFAQRKVSQETFLTPGGLEAYRYKIAGGFGISVDGAVAGTNFGSVSTGSGFELLPDPARDWLVKLKVQMSVAASGDASAGLSAFLQSGDTVLLDEYLDTTGTRTHKAKAKRKQGTVRPVRIDVGGGGFARNGSLSDAEANFEAVLEFLPVPLPAALPLVAAALAGLFAWRRRTAAAR